MLTRCVAVDPLTFAQDYWGRQPLLTRSGDLPRPFDDLLSPEAVDELIAERGVRTPFIRMARDGNLVAREKFVGTAGFGAEMPDQVDSAKVLNQFANGATLVLQGLHRLWPPIIDFVRDAVDDLGHPVQANAYITPASNRGFDPHYDVHDVFVLQVSGRKHWTIHEPIFTDPLSGQPWSDRRAAVEARAAEDPVIDTVLEPGDALYLPRGWLHSARALGQTSIHLTVGVAAITTYDVVRAIVDELAGAQELRGSLPLGADLTSPDEVAAIAQKTIAVLSEVLRDAPAGTAENAGDRIARTFSERTRPTAVRPLATVVAVENLDSTTVVRWRHALIAAVRRNGEKVSLRLTDRTITFPATCAEALEALHAGTPIAAGALPGLDADDGVVLARRLLREAVVVPADLGAGQGA